MIYVRVKLKELMNSYQLLLNENVGAEISLYNTSYIEDINYSTLIRMREIVLENNIKIVVHLPIYSLDIGTKDKFITEYSTNILIKSLDIANVLGAEKAVFHPGINPLNPSKVKEIWYKNFKKNYIKILKVANSHNIQICGENIWDTNDDFFNIFTNDFPNSKLCYDIGHAEAYMNDISIDGFISKYSKHITHLHVHDNMLKEDQHLHLGDGKIEFEKYFKIINRYIDNYTATLETDLDDEIISDITKLRKLIEVN